MTYLGRVLTNVYSDVHALLVENMFSEGKFFSARIHFIESHSAKNFPSGFLCPQLALASRI
jgi:hypothetical protein